MSLMGKEAANVRATAKRKMVRNMLLTTPCLKGTWGQGGEETKSLELQHAVHVNLKLLQCY